MSEIDSQRSTGSSKNAFKRYRREAKGINEIKPSWLSNEEITFGPADSEGVRHPHDDALVIELLVANCRVKRILVDSGASSNLIFLKAFKGMRISDKNLSPSSSQLIGFSGEQLTPLGELMLPVYSGGINLLVRFQVVDADSCYNAIMGRPWIHELQAVPSSFHQVIKFPTPWGIRSIKGEQHVARDCYAITLRTIGMVEEREEIKIASSEGNDATKTTFIGKSSSSDTKKMLTTFLRSRRNAFAFDHAEMPGIDPRVISHKLQVDPRFKPVHQRRRRFTPEKNLAISEEVTNLLKVGFIREVKYPEWLANVVVVKKKKGREKKGDSLKSLLSC